MATWGSTTVKMRVGTYQAPSANAGIVEIPILDDGTANAMSVLQQAGRSRRVISWEGIADNLAHYTSLYNDYIATTERTFSGPDSVSLSCIISELSPPTYIWGGVYSYRIELMEA